MKVIDLVTDFGADNSGSGDCGAEFQLALSALGGPGAIYLQPGTYFVDWARASLQIESNVLITGSGNACTTIVTPDVTSRNANLFMLLNGASAEFRDLTIQGPADPGPFTQNGGPTDLFPSFATSAIYCEQVSTGSTGRLALRDVAIHGGFSSAVNVASGPTGAFNGTFDLAMADCVLSGFVEGISIFAAASSPKRLRMRDCTIRDPYSAGKLRGHMVYLHPHVSLDLADCRFSGPMNPANYAIQHYSGTNVGSLNPRTRLRGCEFRGMQRGILATNKGRTAIEGCDFSTTGIGLQCRDDTDIDRCEFTGPGISTYAQDFTPCSLISIRDSLFNLVGARQGIAATAVATEEWQIRGCDFLWQSGATGMGINQAYSGFGPTQGETTIRGCRFYGPPDSLPNAALAVSGDCGVKKLIADCDFQGRFFVCVQVANGTQFVADTVEIRGNRFLSTGGYGIHSAAGGTTTPLGVIVGSENVFGPGLIAPIGESYAAIEARRIPVCSPLK